MAHASRSTTTDKRFALELRNVTFDLASGCWPWLRSGSKGYGRLVVRGVRKLAHRYFYEEMRGPIPSGLTLDHLCRNRACVNPWHLEPVTVRDNVLRGNGLSAVNARKTHCKRGHEFTEENTRHLSYRPVGRGRICRACERRRDRRRRAAIRESK